MSWGVANESKQGAATPKKRLLMLGTMTPIVKLLRARKLLARIFE